MFVIYTFLIWTFAVWIRRALLTLSSIKKYSCIPDSPWANGREAEMVSVIVPCRNEEDNLDTVIPSLLRQDYPQLELIFLDDRSTDGTLRKLHDYQKKDSRIKILQGKPLPPGWTGKNHAMHQAAQNAAGKWLLFTDADTFHERHSLSSALSYALKRDLKLLTMSARCVCKTFGEHLVQPMGIGCFAVWFKLSEVNNPDNKTPLCCGQYLLVHKETYDLCGGNEVVKNEVTEDLAFFEVLKSKGYSCELSIGTHLFATRMYKSFKECWVGWRRIYLHGLRKDVGSILRKMGMLIFYSFLPFAMLAGFAAGLMQGNTALWPAFWLTLFLCAFILFLRSRSHAALKASQWSILLHPLSALVIIGILADCLHHHFLDKKVVWKQEQY
jgi:chlorobactene glucosyltransferase